MIKSRFMDTIGDGSGSIDANVNGSVTPQIFRIAPEPNETLYVVRLIVFIADQLMTSGGYGQIATLTNGIDMVKKRFVGEAGEFVLFRFFPEGFIKDTKHWKALCHDEILSSYGSGEESLSYRYTFTKDTQGDPVILNGQNKEELQIIINDDLTGLTEHHFRVGMYD